MRERANMDTGKRCACFLFLGCMFGVALVAAKVHATGTPAAKAPKLEIGIDRSNMATEWTLSPPAEPKIYPFNGAYNGAGVFAARRVAVFDGIARLQPQWFRDGFGADTAADAQLFV